MTDQKPVQKKLIKAFGGWWRGASGGREGEFWMFDFGFWMGFPAKTPRREGFFLTAEAQRARRMAPAAYFAKATKARERGPTEV